MLRIVLFLVLIALAAWGAAWVADQPGEVALSLGSGTKYIVTKWFRQHRWPDG